MKPIAKFLLLWLLAAGALAAQAPQRQKKLIEFGWDEPDPEFIKQHAAVMRQRPFDGTIFHLNYRRDDGKTGSFTWEAWGRKRFREADLAPSIQPLLDADLGEFRHNFPRFNVTPADVDWFDDYSAIIENARLVAWYARQTKCPGVAFEVEQYTGKLFDYSKQRDAVTKPWHVYAAQARLRGSEVMRAFQQGYPGLKVFLSLGYSYTWKQMKGRNRRIDEVSYGLLAPFLDGMLEAAEGDTRFIDGHESAYHYLTPEDFPEAYRLMREGVFPIVADPMRYSQRFGFSFGLWMDRNSNKDGWSAEDFSKNGHSPERLEQLVAKSLEVADEYVWLYSERLKWWTAPNGAAEKVPAVYETAVRKARAAAAAVVQNPATPYPRVSEEAFRARLPFFDYDKGAPTQGRVVQQWNTGQSLREKIVFRGAQGFLVPGMLEMPKTGRKPYPLVLLLHGWSGSKSVWWDDQGAHNGGLMRKALLEAGYAVLALDAATHGERSVEIDYQGVNTFADPSGPVWRNYFSYAEISVQTVKDYRRALDYISEHGGIDMRRIGLIGYSMGGMDSFYLLSVEPRIQMAVACVPPLWSPGYGPASPIDYSWGIGDRPFVLLMGRQDTMYDYDKVNASYRAYLEGPKKKLIWYDKGHKLTPVYVPDALAFVKQYLPVEADVKP
ncbi:MAG: alpha/beta fold hydrolase [Acidobacteria bacterium]|nr:alpha/beta fold hydrolase [Acidobacteriota bacterium]